MGDYETMVTTLCFHGSGYERVNKGGREFRFHLRYFGIVLCGWVTGSSV